MVCATLVEALFQLLPGQQLWFAPYGVDGSGTVLSVATLILSVFAVWVAPGSFSRRVIATAILFIYPIALFGYAFLQTQMLSVAIFEMGIAWLIESLRWVAVIGSMGIAWLTASDVTRRAWVALAVLIVIVPWASAARAIASAVYMAVGSEDGGMVVERNDLALNAQSVAAILLSVTIPLAVLLIIGIVLDAKARSARHEAWARSRPVRSQIPAVAPADTPASATTDTPAPGNRSLRIGSVVALLLAVGLGISGIMVWNSSHEWDDTVPQAITLWIVALAFAAVAIVLERLDAHRR
jgi:hypothetical protein